MPAAAGNRDLEIVFEGAERAGLDRETAGGHAGEIVLVGLKNEMNRSRKAVVPRKFQRRADEHRAMAVMAAAVKLAGMHRTMRKAVFLGDRQRVHVRPQADGGLIGSAAQARHDSGASDSP